MSDAYSRLQAIVAKTGIVTSCQLALKTNPSGLPSAWMTLESTKDINRLASELSAIGGRLATITVYRPDAIGAPGTHEVAYHLVLVGMPITVKVTVKEGDSLSSLARLFPNAEWEEREVMELGGVRIDDHPNPRRMFLDETIEEGVFDRFVPYSEFTNTANHGAIWARIKEESDKAKNGKQKAARQVPEVNK